MSPFGQGVKGDAVHLRVKGRALAGDAKGTEFPLLHSKGRVKKIIRRAFFPPMIFSAPPLENIKKSTGVAK